MLLSHEMIHRWEEPCISGRNGTAAFFFGGCSLRCVFCQNAAITSGKVGKIISPSGLCERFFARKAEGAESVDLVTPTHFWDRIAEAVSLAKSKDLGIPLVANTSGYEKAASLDRFARQIDVFLTDFKYLDPALSARYSGAPDYADTALPALEKMVELTGEAVFSPRGVLRKGVVVRHLILPGRTKDSKAVLSLLYERFGNRILYSLMSQYTPPKGIGAQFPELSSPIRNIEYKAVIRHAEKIGITNGFLQEKSAADEKYIPDFQQTAPR